MKKFLSAISLMIVALMILATPISAEETNTETAWQKPHNINVYYATNVSGNAPTIDGVISEGEYGAPIRVENPRALTNESYGTQWLDSDASYDDTLESEYMNFYFAYDETSIYIAIYDAGPAYVDDGDEFKMDNVPFRHNNRLELGFDLNDATSWFQMGLGGGGSVAHFEFGSKKTAIINVYDFFSEGIVTKTDKNTGETVGFGDLLMNGNVNYNAGPWDLVAEFKLDKSVVADCLNQAFYTDYDTISNAMWVQYTTNGYRSVGTFKDDGVTEKIEPTEPTQYVKWLGINDITDKQGEYEAYGLYEGSTRDWMFDLVVFGDENTEIVVADPFPPRPENEPEDLETEVEAEETEVVGETEAKATEAVDNTETPATSGCNGAVSFAGIALVAALGTCTAFVVKKKED